MVEKSSNKHTATTVLSAGNWSTAEGVEEKLGKNVSWKPKELQCLKEEMKVTCVIKSSDKA